MDYSPAKTIAWFGGWGPNFDIHSHAGMVSLCPARGSTVMGNGHPPGVPLFRSNSYLHRVRGPTLMA